MEFLVKISWLTLPCLSCSEKTKKLWVVVLDLITQVCWEVFYCLSHIKSRICQNISYCLLQHELNVEFEMTWEKITFILHSMNIIRENTKFMFLYIILAFQLKASPTWSPSVTPAVCGKDENILLVFISRCTMWE